MIERHLDICEKNEWLVHEYDGGFIELEKYSPAGEDFIFTVEPGEDFTKAVKDYAESYDADEHAELWVEGRGKTGVPGSIRELLDDAEAIGDMLKELAEALEKADKVHGPNDFKMREADIGTLVTEEVVQMFMNALPPACYRSSCAQIGEPYTHRQDEVSGKWRPVFGTFRRVRDEVWEYRGNCFYGETEERGRDMPVV